MQSFSFEVNYYTLFVSLIALLISYLLFKRNKKFVQPTLYFSNMDSSWVKTDGWKTTLSKLPNKLNFIGLLFFLTAFTDPHLVIPKKQGDQPRDKNRIPSEGIAIYLLLDQSGSMGEEVTATINGNRQRITKEALLRQVTADFVKGRPDDMIGLVTFARVPQVESPLTLDHAQILDELSKISVVKNREDDGTAMGYAIFKTVSMIAATKHYAEELAVKGRPSYAIKNSIIILVTDGLQDPSILDKDSRLRNIGLEQAANFAKANGIQLYLINIDPNTYSEELTPQRNQMKKITELTGGRLFIVNDPGEISQIFSDINRLEKTALPQENISKENQPNLFRRISFYPYLIGLGMLLLLGALLINTVVARRVP